MALLVPVVLCRVKMMTIELSVIFHAALDEENLVGPIAVLALDRSGVILTSVLEFRLAFVPLAGLLRRGAPVILAVRVQRLDELFLDPSLVLPIFISNIVGAIAPITANLAGVELTSAACEL